MSYRWHLTRDAGHLLSLPVKAVWRGCAMEIPDYYEFLQISPSAEADTVHRVYRYLAARFHPDNRETGNAERFFMLTQAYEVLSDPERRAAYDVTRQTTPQEPLSTWIDFMDNMEGELNRRLAVLTV